MTWFKIDDGLSDHPKMVLLQSKKGWQKALALWTLSGAWCSKHLTDGFVPSAIVSRLGCSDKDAALLVIVGFWARVENGYSFHDWTSMNPSRATVESKREKVRTKVTTWRRNQVTDAVTTDASNPAPVPSRPVPSRPEGSESAARPPVSTKRQIGSAHIQELSDVIGQVAEQLDVTAPRPTRDQTWQIAERVADMASKRGVTYREAAFELVRAAFAAKGRFAFELLEIDPYAGSQAAKPALSPLAVDAMAKARAREAVEETPESISDESREMLAGLLKGKRRVTL